MTSRYLGRFAPSPTGPLHFGSLVAAVASFLEAKTHGGDWLLRMEDLDKPREVAGAADDILRTLDGFGFAWHGEVVYQSQRTELYENALRALASHDLIYPCTCSRKEIADSALQIGLEGKIYPKTCITNSPKANIQAAFRLITSDEPVQFHDAIQGEITQNLARDIGDFVLKRADGLIAYQLAVVADDAAQGITHIVRGADLLDSTPRQIYLQKLLNLPIPQHAHVPIVVNGQGEKLSKQTLAAPICREHAAEQLFEALHFLGQSPPIEMKKNATLEEVWRWASNNWSLQKVLKIRTQSAI